MVVLSKKNVSDINELIGEYISTKKQIADRLEEFRQKYKNGSEEDIFEELTFCLMTPQSKAKSCWATATDLRCKGLMLEGDCDCLSKQMNRVRFRNHKASYIIEARRIFTLSKKVHMKEKIDEFTDPFQLRQWLVDTVKGLGFKEASHFLRNIGKGSKLAILDRHILKNLKKFGAIPEIPRSLSKKTYLELEKKMHQFSTEIGIPMDHLDLLLWYLETGEFFK
jgi:N-glycosylase/DNA lyase